MVRNGESNDRKTEQFRKLFIGGLNPGTDEQKLKDYYSKWGEIVDAVVMKDRRSGRSKGFGFITYREPEMVDTAQANRPHTLDGKTVESKRAMPREDSTNPESHMTVSKLFVGGLKKEVTSEELFDYFKKYGSIKDHEVVKFKETGESRGFGFVTFDDYDAVDKAILYKPHFIGQSKADVKKALSKEQMNEIKKKNENRFEGYGAPNPYNGGYPNPYAGGYGQMGGYGQDAWGGGYGGASNGGYGGNWGPNQMGGGGGGGGWGANGMGDGFGQYGNQQNYGGGPMRPNQGGGNYQRSAPYGSGGGGGFGRR